MRRMVMAGGALAAALAVSGMVMACDSSQAKQAAADGATCTKSMAEAAYAKSLAATGCEKTARQAAYDAVLEATGCAKTAEAAAARAGMSDTDAAHCQKADGEAAAATTAAVTGAKGACPFDAGKDATSSQGTEKGATVKASDDTVVRVGSACPLGGSKDAAATTAKAGGERCTGDAAETLAVTTYNRSRSETGCAKTARQAAYDAVLASTGCAKRAENAARLAAARAAYDDTLKATGCAVTAQEEYDRVAKGGEPVKVAEAVAEGAGAQ